jgi:hypothetical protein
MNTLLKNTISDLVSDLMYYDRKEDEELPRGEIEKMIESEETSVDAIVSEFRNELTKATESRD